MLARYSYDNLGRRTSLARAGGTAMTTTFAYPTTDVRLSQMAHNIAGTADDLTLDFLNGLRGRVFFGKPLRTFPENASGDAGLAFPARKQKANNSHSWTGQSAKILPKSHYIPTAFEFSLNSSRGVVLTVRFRRT